jgi:hypothetical protein
MATRRRPNASSQPWVEFDEVESRSGVSAERHPKPVVEIPASAQWWE